MATRRKKVAAAAEDADADAGAPVADKIANLLALIAIRDMAKEDAAIRLHGAGFNAREIAALLDVGSNYLHALKHRKKNAPKKKPAKKTS